MEEGWVEVLLVAEHAQEGEAEVPVAGAADVAGGVGGAALAGARVKAGVGDPLLGLIRQTGATARGDTADEAILMVS